MRSFKITLKSNKYGTYDTMASFDTITDLSKWICARVKQDVEEVVAIYEKIDGQFVRI